MWKILRKLYEMFLAWSSWKLCFSYSWPEQLSLKITIYIINVIALSCSASSIKTTVINFQGPYGNFGDERSNAKIKTKICTIFLWATFSWYLKFQDMTRRTHWHLFEILIFRNRWTTSVYDLEGNNIWL